MTRSQFRLLVVLNQLVLFGAVVVHELSFRSFPPEFKSYFGFDESVLDPQGSPPLTAVPYWLGFALLGTGVIAAVGLCLGKRWGRTLYLLTALGSLMFTLMSDFAVSTGWTTFLSYLAGSTEGMILGLVYFSHIRRIFEPDKEPQLDPH